MKKKNDIFESDSGEEEEEEEEEDEEQKEEGNEGDDEEEKEKEEIKIPKKPKYISSIIDLNENEENEPVKKKNQDKLYGIQILGLPYEATEYELRQMFSKYGNILKIYLPKYKNTNKNKIKY